MIKTEPSEKSITVSPFMKVIGKKTFIVESYFDDESKQTIEKKICRLIDRDLTLLSKEVELTSQEP